jgi:hypothetical protein
LIMSVEEVLKAPAEIFAFTLKEFFLFPFNSCWWFVGDVVYHPCY